ncbi:MAG: protease inhibitor I42 family protein [Clostridiales bacterium]|jgi:predicted secreted protein|nr:protease inhibitor I42 family protein [Clostridiales bacterium]
MKKAICFAIAVCLTLGASYVTVRAVYGANSAPLMIDGVESDSRTITNASGAVGLPLRAVAEAAGFTVTYNPDGIRPEFAPEPAQIRPGKFSGPSVTLLKGAYSTNVAIGGEFAVVDGRTYAPAEYFERELGLTVRTNEEGGAEVLTGNRTLDAERRTIFVNVGDEFYIRSRDAVDPNLRQVFIPSDGIRPLGEAVLTRMAAGNLRQFTAVADRPGVFPLTIAVTDSDGQQLETRTYTAVVSPKPLKISARVGTPFPVALEENASTGYVWTFEVPDGLQLESDTIEREEASNIVGAPHTHIWNFVATQSGGYTLTFRYARPWEQVPVRWQTIEVTVI